MAYSARCKATLLAVDHDFQRFEEMLERFKPFVRRGATLWVEFPQRDLEQVQTGNFPSGNLYAVLIDYALWKGMKVEALDRRETYTEYQKFLRLEKRWGDIKHVAEEAGLSAKEVFRVSKKYGNMPFREGRWLDEGLREAREGDVIMMHPMHALRVAPRLGIDPKKRHKLTPQRYTHGQAGVYEFHPARLRKFKRFVELLKKRRLW